MSVRVNGAQRSLYRELRQIAVSHPEFSSGSVIARGEVKRNEAYPELVEGRTSLKLMVESLKIAVIERSRDVSDSATSSLINRKTIQIPFFKGMSEGIKGYIEKLHSSANGNLMK